jgi:hypothetical protein
MTTQGFFTLLLRAIFAHCSTQPSNWDCVKELPVRFAVNGITLGETSTLLGPYWDAYL